MHSANFDIEAGTGRDGGDVLVAIAALVTEGRIPAKGPLTSVSSNAATSNHRGFYEGPHCTATTKSTPHSCNPTDDLCQRYEFIKEKVLNLWQKGIPLCVEVSLASNCPCRENVGDENNSDDDLLLEKWYFSITQDRPSDVSVPFNVNQLISAVRSQLYFSQISAWLSCQDLGAPHISNANLKYRLAIPGETFDQPKFNENANEHLFPTTDMGNGLQLNVTLLSLPRMSKPPSNVCTKCKSDDLSSAEDIWMLDDRMHTKCTLKGKHRCEDFDDFDVKKEYKFLKSCGSCSLSQPSTSGSSEKRNIESVGAGVGDTKTPKLDFMLNRDEFREAMGVMENDLSNQQNGRGDVLLNAILRSCRLQDGGSGHMSECDVKCVQSECNSRNLKINGSGEIFSKKICSSFSDNCDSASNNKRKGCKSKVRQKIQFDDFKQPADKSSITIDIPSPFEKAKFRKNLDSAASMVFHSRTGLPLTSSPAPIRRGKSCFDYDSSINSVSDIKSALFSASFSTDDDSESDGSIVSPCSPETYIYTQKPQPTPVKVYRRSHSANLLGSFEESVLNGRLEPVSTVHGFKAELGASGSFVPRHLVVPVTVFFYTLGDNDKVSSPYLGHINLGRKGYNVPKTGTIQVTLFNPLGTVVKMFVIMYNLADMPPNSQTFIRQRTLYMPTNCHDKELEWGPKWLRYLIHLRFMSSKSGRIYLHSDIRMIIFRKSDVDTATAHGIDMCYELRSFTHMPVNPKYSPRK
ncbi:PREDICTED: protein FAM214A isoform X2 [Nicrophorus vespilloides]|nr:PREDICTED: protein FAM214A isoform X2 [Nicrophorus vespilloides]XP_017784074.1 PREDICTED: protein FAM214A isoform X2 [Nicrophorus vespilloides]